MKFMILVKSTPELEARLATMSDAQMKEQMAAMEAFNEETQEGRRAEGLRRSAPEPRGKAGALRRRLAHRR